MYDPKTGINAAKKNKSLIEKWLADHPQTTGIEICRALNLSSPTVYKHLAVIKREHELNNPDK